MAKIKGAIVVDTERCKGCNLCVVACPLHVISLTAKEVNKKDIRLPNKYWKILATAVRLVLQCVPTDASVYIK